MINFRILVEEFKTGRLKLVKILAVCCWTQTHWSTTDDEQKSTI